MKATTQSAGATVSPWRVHPPEGGGVTTEWLLDGAKSESIELEASKVERKLSMPKSEEQLSHPLSLPNWQMRKLQNLNAVEGKEFGMGTKMKYTSS
jgi:hypothetical protein